MPIYNAERYLSECIRSLISQTYTDLEILLINDGSTDSSAAIASRYARRDSRIVLRGTLNRGQAAARNTGLELATGEWVLFVDADDYLAPDCIARLIAAIGERDVLQYGYRVVTEDGKPLYKQIPWHPYLLTTPWSRLYRRAFLDRNRLRFPVGHIYEDVRFSMMLWATRPRQRILPYIGYYYRRNAGSTTSRRHRHEEELLYRDLRTIGKGFRMWLLRCYTLWRLKFHFRKTPYYPEPSNTPYKP